MNNIIVLKCGGSIINQLSESFFTSVQKLKDNGHKIIIVHGGGPEIGNMLTELNIKTEFVNGLRKTSKEVMDVVEMILAGKVNKHLVSKLCKSGLYSLGLSGMDANLLSAKAIDIETLGYVGEVSSINSALLYQLLNLDYLPVISPIGIDSEGNKYNINADSAAGSIATELKAKQLIFVTDVPGVLDNDKLLNCVTTKEITTLIGEEKIYGGMIPKVMAACNALKGELKEVMIVSGKQSFAGESGEVIGTKIVNELEVVI